LTERLVFAVTYSILMTLATTRGRQLPPTVARLELERNVLIRGRA